MIGISSYLLINFWFNRVQANKSAIKALTVNRVGDMFLTVGFFAIFFLFGNLDYSTVFTLSTYMNKTVLTVIGLTFLLAAMGKSAQLGLHTWLPEAMEGRLKQGSFILLYLLLCIFYTVNVETVFLSTLLYLQAPLGLVNMVKKNWKLLLETF